MGAQRMSIQPGLAHPVFDSQRVFRDALDALSRPGCPVVCSVDLPSRFQVAPSALALLLALLDADVSLWVQPGDVDDQLVNYLRFHTGVSSVSDPGSADFALINLASRPDHESVLSGLSVLSLLRQGTAASPDQSATLIVCVPDFSEGARVELSGPGCHGSVPCAVGGFDHETWKMLIDNRQQAPLGIDVLLSCGQNIVGLPRSTGIRFMPSATTDLQPLTEL